ncbi:MAG TPA: tetratricopeptide repeat protein [Candidatus Sulfotelmatobacter sp.]|jgi:tetratricopeptide (TPR) repeat protein|nr:tetratricopeptide repeat protein [Candidatus Sulfotelmatobacter sp.]
MTGIRLLRRLCALATTLFPVALILFVFYTSAQTSDDPLALIASALQNKQFKEALDLLGPAIQKSPQNAQLWAMQGTAYAGQGHKKEALTSFRNASKIAPNYVPALQGEVQIEYEAGSAAAIPVLRHLLRLKPDDRTSHGMLAVLEYQQGNCNEAATHFEKAGNLFDSQVEGLHAYAVCLVKIRQFDRAATVFQRSLTLEPDDKRERQLLASIQLMAKQPQAAIASLASLLRADPPDVESLELASAAYEDAHDTERAVDVLRQAILLAPNNVNLYSDFANLSSLHQSFQVGINVVNDGLALQPKAAPLYFARGILYVELGEYDKGQADFETAYELDPNQSLSTAALGLAAMQQNNLDQALASVQAKLVRTPSDPILLYLQADVLTQKGAELGSPEFESAMRSAKKAVELRPALGPARSVLAKLYLQSGHYPEAAAQCRRALEIDPKDQVALYHLIQALRKSGSKTEIPDLLKRLALARQDATREERELYRYRLVEGDAPTK